MISASYDDRSKHLVVPTKLQVDKVTTYPSALVDSGATSNFINHRFVDKHHLPTQPRAFPLPVQDIDGRRLGVLDKEVNGKLRMGNHEENITFDVAPTGRYPLVLGLPWMKTHEPSIQWKNHRLTFDDAYCATNCLDTPLDVI